MFFKFVNNWLLLWADILWSYLQLHGKISNAIFAFYRKIRNSRLYYTELESFDAESATDTKSGSIDERIEANGLR